MSKYLGKLLLENVIEEPTSVSVKYVFSRDAFCFRYECASGTYAMYVGSDLCYAVAGLVGTLDFQYQWSVGYSVKEKKKAEHLSEMRNEELNLLGGRKKLVLSGQLDNDVDFDILCVIQYLYQFSTCVLNEVMKQSKRRKWGRAESCYVQLTKRKQCLGRKKGSKNRESFNEDVETLEETLNRCRHNKRVAIEKGFIAWYLDACREECKALGKKLNKVQMLAQWNKERGDLD